MTPTPTIEQRSRLRALTDRLLAAALDIRGWGGFILLAAAGLALRYFLAPHPGYEYDLNAFSYWAKLGRPFAFLGFFAGPPEPKLSFPNYALYFPMLAALGPAADAVTAAGRTLLRTPAIIGDILLAATVYVCAKPKWKLVAAAFIMFNPVVWFDSAVFGQVDSLHTVFMVLAILFASRRKYRGAWVCIIVAVFFKLQAVVLLPLIAALSYKDIGAKRSLREMVPGAVAAALIILPYALATSFSALWKSAQKSFGMFDLVTINAWNPWFFLHLFSNRWVHDTEMIFGISYAQIGLTALAAAVVAIIGVLPKRPGHTMIFAAAAAMCFSFFILPTEIHERYSYPILPLLAVVAVESPLVAVIAALASVIIFFDINLVHPWSPIIGFFVKDGYICALWSLVFTFLFIVYLGWYFRSAKKERTIVE